MTEQSADLEGVSPDGYWVEIAASFPDKGEADMIHSWLGAGQDILDLGCGAGRISRRLAVLGHPVVAVDHSAGMLARIAPHARLETVHASIEELHLERSFDAVLLTSNLVSVAPSQVRQSFFETAREHLAPHGTLLVEWFPPAWFGTPGRKSAALRGFAVEQIKEPNSDGSMTLTVEFRRDSHMWTHQDTVRKISEGELEQSLAVAGLAFGGWRTDDRKWFAASRMG